MENHIEYAPLHDRKVLVSKKMTIIHTGVVFSPAIKNPYTEEYIYNFNHAPNLVNINDGNYLAAWFSGPWEIHPYQRILMSRFDGVNWTEPEIIQNTMGVSDFDPAFIRSGNKIYLFYSNARKFSPRLHSEKKGFLGTYYRYSSDFGQSWSKPSLLSTDYACKSNGLCLKNGHLLLPVYNTAANQLGVFKSIDDGNTWELYASDPIAIPIAEPSIIEFKEGNIVMIARTKTGTLWISELMNNGESLTMPLPSSIESYNTPASLLMDNNSLLVCYNLGRKRNKLCISSTETLSFQLDSIIVVDQIKDNINSESNAIHPSGSDFAVTYPSMINYGEDKVMVAWSRYEINESEHKGEICYCIVKIEADSFE